MTRSGMVAITVIEGGEETVLTESSGFSVASIRTKLGIPANYTCVGEDGTSVGNSATFSQDTQIEFVPPTKEKAAPRTKQVRSPKSAKATKVARKVAKKATKRS